MTTALIGAGVMACLIFAIYLLCKLPTVSSRSSQWVGEDIHIASKDMKLKPAIHVVQLQPQCEGAKIPHKVSLN